MKTYFKFFLIIALFASFASVTEAVVVSNNPVSGVGAQDVFVLDILLNTEGETINTIEGNILLKNEASAFEVRDISIAGSEIALWARSPSLSENGDMISFTGGIPGGISGKNLHLFKIVLLAPNPSEMKISSSEMFAFAHDGKGTKISVQGNFSPIVIGDEKQTPADAWRDEISEDNTPPEMFDIFLYQDENLFGNSKFLSFSTSDKDSGMSHYMVKEGDREAVRTGETYVLLDQELESSVSVTAYDIAGNARTVTFDYDQQGTDWSSIILGVLIGTIVILCIKFITVFFKYWNMSSRK